MEKGLTIVLQLTILLYKPSRLGVIISNHKRGIGVKDVLNATPNTIHLKVIPIIHLIKPIGGWIRGMTPCHLVEGNPLLVVYFRGHEKK